MNHPQIIPDFGLSFGRLCGLASRLRAFAPSRENQKARLENLARHLKPGATANRSRETKPHFSPLPHEEINFFENFQAGWRWLVSLFPREGAKARRREGKGIEIFSSLTFSASVPSPAPLPLYLRSTPRTFLIL